MDGGCGATLETVRARMVGQQSDEKMTSMQKDFNVVKTDHEDRLKELEASVQKMLRSAVPGPNSNVVFSAPGDNTVSLKRVPIQQNRSESGLLLRLHDEFEKLRTNLQEKSKALLEKEAQLNETTLALIDAQDDLFRTSEKLILSDHKAATLEQERYILKNQVKDKTEKLDQALEKVNVSDTKISNLEKQLYKLVRSEANLKEEVGYYIWKLNKTAKEMKQLQANHTDLKAKHAKTKQQLRGTELDLMECYAGKTQSFCGFENDDVCGFTQENSTDDFDWTRGQGGTPSAGTGPDEDHTCKHPKAGHFMFIEASVKAPRQSAIMYSPKYRGFNGLCIGFYYHMYGRHVGTLNVYTKTENGEALESAWRAYGNQGNLWLEALLSIPKSLSKVGFQLVFEGITRNGYQGDIAVDDISVKDGECDSKTVTAVSVNADKVALDKLQSRRLRRYRQYRRQMRHNAKS
ncbi:hypothetical protein FSP39_004295 [Pinctada imbricata]|uniref:MAM domain-containing protein n=1 Tax=Pinctada imbricata TaxID=66713 RepID=A0AA89C4M5_PINIB|nr:hypothetical protein FSP39_004295 [Pinctada imbricata]